MGLQLINPMEMIMVTEFFVRLLSAFARTRARKYASKMLQMDEHLLRDIGLTRSDVLNCMSAQPQKEGSCLPGRRSENLDRAVTKATVAVSARTQAAPPPGELAA